MAGCGVSRVHALIGAVLIVCACGQAAPAPSGTPTQTGQPTTSAAPQPTTSTGSPDLGTLVDFTTTTDPAASAGREQELTAQLRDDTGTIALEQTGVRGIGKKTLEFKVGVADYRVVNAQTALGGLSGTKCDGKRGTWTLTNGGQIPGTTTFTLPADGSSAPAHTDLFANLGGGATAHYVLDGSAAVVTRQDGLVGLQFVLGSGTLTVTSPEGTETANISFPGTQYDLEEGDFCGSS